MKNSQRPLKTNIAVLGAGAWGTALAAHLSRCNHHVTLWGRDSEQMATMANTKINPKYLSDLKLPNKLEYSGKIGAWISECRYLVIAVPSQVVAELLESIKNLIHPHTRIIIASKGAHRDASQNIEFLTQTSTRILADTTQHAVLSGPSFAHELVIGIPTAVVIAAHKATIADEIAALFHNQNFRIYPSTDPVGVQLASIGKNVIAVAAGAADGMQLGDNTRAALICRGLNELLKLGTAMQLDPNSFTGLAGIGDIILTCTCDSSRNRRFGMALGTGLSSSQSAKTVGKLVEAQANAELLLELAKTNHVEMPITHKVCQVLNDELNVRDAMADLLARPLPSDKS